MPEIEKWYRATVSGWWSERYTRQAIVASGSRKFGSVTRVLPVLPNQKSPDPGYVPPHQLLDARPCKGGPNHATASPRDVLMSQEESDQQSGTNG